MSTVGDAHGTRSAEVIEVIRTVATRGDGESTIFREVISYWAKDGTLLAEVDCCGTEELSIQLATAQDAAVKFAHERDEARTELAASEGVVSLMRSLSINPTIPDGIRSLMKSALPD